MPLFMLRRWSVEPVADAPVLLDFGPVGDPSPSPLPPFPLLSLIPRALCPRLRFAVLIANRLLTRRGRRHRRFGPATTRCRLLWHALATLRCSRRCPGRHRPRSVLPQHQSRTDSRARRRNVRMAGAIIPRVCDSWQAPSQERTSCILCALGRERGEVEKAGIFAGEVAYRPKQPHRGRAAWGSAYSIVESARIEATCARAGALSFVGVSHLTRCSVILLR